MPFTTLTSGLTITIPTSGTVNWASTLQTECWAKISAHDHTGSGMGNTIGSSALSDSAVTSAKLADDAVTTAKIADGAVTTVKIADDAVTSAKVGPNLALTQQATLTPSGTTQAIDWDTGNIARLNLGSATGDVTLTLSNPASGATYRILVTQGATARNLVWPAAVLWPQAVDPILSTGNGDVDQIVLYYDGTNYYGDWEVDYS